MKAHLSLRVCSILVAAILIGTVCGASGFAVYDPFAYLVSTNLDTQSPAPGASWADAGPAGPQITVQPGNQGVSGLPAPVGNRVEFRAAVGPSCRLSFGTNVTNGTIFFSFALRIADLAGLGPNGGFFAGLNPGVGPQPTTPSVIGTRVLARTVPGGYNLGLTKASSNVVDFVWDTNVFTIQHVVFVVGSYTFAGSSTNDDLARLWINPNPASFGAGAPPPGFLASTSGLDLTEIRSFVFMQRPAPAQAAISLADELRIGDSWAAVSPAAPLPSDFGDAPAPFPTLVAANGARHILTNGPFFGLNIDAEPDGLPNPTATGDDVTMVPDDEDGITFPWAAIVPGIANPIHIRVAGPGGFVNAWIDFNRNSQWTTNEQIYRNLYLTPGLHMINFPVPASASNGMSFARFRISTTTNLWFDGVAVDGEVEDYRVTITNRSRLNFNGLAHEANGNTSLEPASNLLQVVNLNATGDSVRIETGAVEGWRARIGYMEGACMGSLVTRAGATFRTALNGVVSGSNAVVYAAQFEGTGSNTLFTTDFSGINATRASVSLVGRSNVVLRQLILSNHMALAFAPSSSNCAATWRIQVANRLGTANSPEDIQPPVLWAFSSDDNGGEMQVTLPGQDVVNGVVAMVLDPLDETVQVNSISGAEFSGANVERFTLSREAVQRFKLFHGNLGDAQFETEENPAGLSSLVVTNIGSDGTDGIVIGTIRAGLNSSYWPVYEDSIQFKTEPIHFNSPPGLPAKPNLRSSLVRFGGQELEFGGQELELGGQELELGGQELEFGGQELGFASLTASDNNDVLLRCNFSGVGSSNIVLDVYDGAVLAGRMTLPAGDIGNIAGGAPFVGGRWATFPTTFRAEFASAFTLLVPGHPPLGGTSFEIAAADATEVPTGAAAVSIAVGDLPRVVITNVVIVQRELDFGDAPAPPYLTCLPSGARHRVIGQYCLGVLIDTEANCQVNDNLVGTADEDGVTFNPPPPWLPGTVVNVTAFVTKSGAMPARFDGWLDANGVAGFQAADRIFTGVPLAAGANALNFTVPAAAPVGATWARFRLSQAGVAGPGGYAPDGEVEDYQVAITRQNFAVSGLPHSTFGNAVATEIEPDRIVISNINAYGQDGIRIHLGESEGWIGTVGADLAASGRLEWQMRGTTQSPSNIVGRGSMVHNDGEIYAFADSSSIGATAHLVRAYSNGVLLASNVVPTAQAVYRFVGAAPSDIVIKWEMPRPDDRNPTCSGRWPQPCPIIINVPGGPVLNADSVSVTPVNATTPVCSLSTLEFTGTGVQALRIRDQHVRAFGHYHRAPATSILDPSISLCGSESNRIHLSGYDQTNGMVIVPVAPDLSHPIPVKHLNLSLLPVHLAANGAAFWLSATGRVSDGSIRSLGRTCLTRNGGALQIEAGFNDLGATQVRLDVISNYVAVGSITVPAGMLGTIAGNGAIVGCGKLAPGPTSPPCFWIDFNNFMTFTIGQQSFHGNELRVLAANATTQVLSLGNFEIQDIRVADPLVILGESSRARAPRLNPVVLVSGGNAGLRFGTERGVTYAIEYRNSLSVGSWDPLQSVIGTGGPLIVDDETAITPMRIYRVIAE